MNLESLLKHLEANVSEEIATKHKVLLNIEAQESSVTSQELDSFEQQLEEMNGILAADTSRSSRRARLLDELSELWKVPADALTLGAIVRRLGPEGARLEELRSELRGVVADVLRRNRRLSSLIGMHRRLNRDIVNTVLGAEEKDGLPSSGALLDAEA